MMRTANPADKSPTSYLARERPRIARPLSCYNPANGLHEKPWAPGDENEVRRSRR